MKVYYSLYVSYKCVYSVYRNLIPSFNISGKPKVSIRSLQHDTVSFLDSKERCHLIRIVSTYTLSARRPVKIYLVAYCTNTEL